MPQILKYSLQISLYHGLIVYCTLLFLKTYSNLLSILGKALKKIVFFSQNSITPILIAAFSYPLGNTLCKFACEGKYKNLNVQKYETSKKPLNQILLMVLGALPLIFFSWFYCETFCPNSLST